MVELINSLIRKVYGPLRNFFHASLKLERKEHTCGRLKRIYGKAQTPLARVLASAQVNAPINDAWSKKKLGSIPSPSNKSWPGA